MYDSGSIMKMIRFFQAVYWDNHLRRGAQRRGLARDISRYLKNRCLQIPERFLIRRNYREDLPIVFIVGVPRSGTTLLFQLMSRYLDLGYVNNYMARYWMAPIWGGGSYRRRWSGTHQKGELESDFGGTSDLDDPHEFSWFWQFHTEFGACDHLREQELRAIDWRPIRRELLGLAGWFGRPLVFKSINYVNYHVDWFRRLLPDARFVWIQRERRFTARSILKVREQRYGDPAIWWSVRPRDLAAWRERSPEEQVAHQIRDIEGALERGFSNLPEGKGLRLTYEALTRQPREILTQLAGFSGAAIKDEEGLRNLRLENRNRHLENSEFAAIESALEGSP